MCTIHWTLRGNTPLRRQRLAMARCLHFAVVLRGDSVPRARAVPASGSHLVSPHYYNSPTGTLPGALPNPVNTGNLLVCLLHVYITHPVCSLFRIPQYHYAPRPIKRWRNEAKTQLDLRNARAWQAAGQQSQPDAELLYQRVTIHWRTTNTPQLFQSPLLGILSKLIIHEINE